MDYNITACTVCVQQFTAAISERKKGGSINMAIHESGEDYLEAILMIKKRNGNVRSIDIAHELS